MKAKEWYEKLHQVKTGEEFEKVLTNCLESLVNDADHLIKIRQARSDKSVSACIDEVNNKWISIVNMLEKDFQDESSIMYKCKIYKDGFKSAYIIKHPNKGWYFDLKSHKAKVENEERLLGMKGLYIPTLKLFKMAEPAQLEVSDLHKEVFGTLYLIGSLSKDKRDSAYTFMLILSKHVTLLRYWIKAQSIDVSDVDLIFNDPNKLDEKYGRLD